MNYTNPITSKAEAQDFLSQLHQSGNLFHPEDNPADIIKGRTGEALFTTTEATHIAQRMDEVFQHLADPCEYALTLICPNTNQEQK
jgi:hypothetical protein